MVLNGAVHLLPPIVNLLASFLVIHFGSEAIWGTFVIPMIYAGLALHILSWGNREFLLRAFARYPKESGIMFRQNLVTRGSLLFIALPAVLLAGLPMEATSFLLLWIFAGFFRQSFDVVIVYRKDFGLALFFELLAAALLIGGLLLYRAALTPLLILKLFALAQVVKCLGVGIWYGPGWLPGTYPRIQFRYFYVALPFFLLGFAGMLLSRTDLYCVAWFMDEAAVGRYQVLVNMFVYLQATAAFALLPFAKNLYRLPDRSIWKLSRRMVPLGLLVGAVGLPLVALVVGQVFGLDFDWTYYAVALAFLLPVFAYSPIIYLLYKHNQQQKVLLANAGGILLNFGLNLVLIPRMELLGALVATTAAQILTMALLLTYARQISRESKGNH